MQTIRSSGPMMTPTIPPVTNLTDFNGALITLDCEVIVTRLRHLRGAEPTCRAKVVGIGDDGHPGRKIVRVRPYGSTYVEGAQPQDCEVHVFDEYAWLLAESAAAFEQNRLGRDLRKCLFGGFYFGPFQRFAIRSYVSARTS